MRKTQTSMYRARKKDLVVESIDDEVLVYDLKRHKAHCLNRTAALVWAECDGKHDVSGIVAALRDSFDEPISKEAVELALSQLARERLLDSGPQAASLPDLSRRRLIKGAGLAAAVALPLITSVMAPTPAQAATCLAKGKTCSSSLQCCSKICSAGKCL